MMSNENLSIFYFSFDNSKYEIDFIVQNENDEIIPVEVKSGENLKARSFRLFCEKYKPQTAIRSSLSNFHEEDLLVNVPLYVVGSFLRYNNKPSP